jgi:hypothetical protein
MILIAGTPYSLTVLPDGFDLCKSSGECHRLTLSQSGPFQAHCDCPDYRFRREGNDSLGCKHIRSLREAGLIPALEPAMA